MQSRQQRLDIQQGPRCSANGRHLNKQCVQRDAGSIPFLLFKHQAVNSYPGSTPGSWQLQGQGPRPCGQDQGKNTKQATRQLSVLGVHLMLGPFLELTHNHPTCPPCHLFAILQKRIVPGQKPGQLGPSAGAP